MTIRSISALGIKNGLKATLILVAALSLAGCEKPQVQNVAGPLPANVYIYINKVRANELYEEAVKFGYNPKATSNKVAYFVEIIPVIGMSLSKMMRDEVSNQARSSEIVFLNSREGDTLYFPSGWETVDFSASQKFARTFLLREYHWALVKEKAAYDKCFASDFKDCD